jgi:hypothetical protein
MSRGAVGTTGFDGVTLFDSDDSGPEPDGLTAWTLNR